MSDEYPLTIPELTPARAELMRHFLEHTNDYVSFEIPTEYAGRQLVHQIDFNFFKVALITIPRSAARALWEDLSRKLGEQSVAKRILETTAREQELETRRLQEELRCVRAGLDRKLPRGRKMSDYRLSDETKGLMLLTGIVSAFAGAGIATLVLWITGCLR